MSIEIPTCNDDEWLRDMLSNLRIRVEKVTDIVADNNEEAYLYMQSIEKILDALQEYTG